MAIHRTVVPALIAVSLLAATPRGPGQPPPDYRGDLGIDFTDVEPVESDRSAHVTRIAKILGMHFRARCL